MSEFQLALLFMFLPVLVFGALQYNRESSPVKVRPKYEPALEGARLLREWCGWLATISTAAIGAAAFSPTGIFKDVANPVLPSIGAIAFSCSIICTATLLLALPSLVTRLKEGKSEDNDIYEAVAFLWSPKETEKLLRIGFLAAAQYYFFVVGIVVFGYLAANRPVAAQVTFNPFI